MSKILVSGLINIETTLQIEGFPIAYTPVRYPFFGVNSTVSGVGYNVAKALTRLGHEVRLASLVGRDFAGGLVTETVVEDGITGGFVLPRLQQTAQSVILYDPDGKRLINTDLKDIQEAVYPPKHFAQALSGCDLAVLCNINFSRPTLRLARAQGVPIATDVHTIADLDDAYNAEFMAAADILFMSDEHLPCAADEWARRVQDQYDTPIVGIGLGAAGALLAVKGAGVVHFPAVSTRPVINTIGAGDALFSAFLSGYARLADPHEAMRRAVVFASYKIGETGAAEGFLDAAGLEALVERVKMGGNRNGAE